MSAKRVTRASSKAASRGTTPASVRSAAAGGPRTSPYNGHGQDAVVTAAELAALRPSTVGPQQNFSYGSPDSAAPAATEHRGRAPLVASVITETLHAARIESQDDPPSSGDEAQRGPVEEALEASFRPSTRSMTRSTRIDADITEPSRFRTPDPLDAVLPRFRRTPAKTPPAKTPPARIRTPSAAQRSKPPATRRESRFIDDQSTKGVAYYILGICALLIAAWAGARGMGYLRGHKAPGFPIYDHETSGLPIPKPLLQDLQRTADMLKELAADQRSFRSAQAQMMSVQDSIMVDVGSIKEHQATFAASMDERMSAVEGDVRFIKEETHLHRTAIQRLEEILPENVVVKTGKDGKVEIEPSFWRALKEKLGEGHGTGNRLDPNVMDADGSTALQSQWDAFLATNERKVEELVEKSFAQTGQKEWVKVIHDNAILTKPEFLDLLDQKHQEFTGELDRVAKDLHGQYRRLQYALNEDLHETIMQGYNSISRDQIMSRITPAQLEGMASAALTANAYDAQSRIDWFSPSLGAMIDPHGTSPTFQPKPKSFTRRFGKLFNYGLIDGYSPDTTLTSWHDIGECWCTYNKPGAQLVVDTPHPLYPDEVVVEFAPANATPDFATAPRAVELWAKFEGIGPVVNGLEELEEQLGRSLTNQDVRGGWLPLTKFQYDIRHINHVQTFPIRINLERYGTKVVKLGFRLLDNWGDEDRICLYRVRLHATGDPKVQ